MSILKVGPPFKPSGTSWNNRGKKDITQIFISSTQSRIKCIYVTYLSYVENEGDQKVVLSDKISGDGEPSTSMETVTFDYPSEYITRVSGECGKCNAGTYLTRITFHSNKSSYGPYGPTTPDVSGGVIEFNYHAGGNFYGFFGTNNPGGVESIGIYMKPIKRTASQQSERDKDLDEQLSAKRSKAMNELASKVYSYAGLFSGRRLN